MLHTHSNEYKHHTNNLKQVLKGYYADTGISDLYLTDHCKNIVMERLTEAQIFGCGFTKVYHRQNINSYLRLERILIICNITDEEMSQIDEIEYLFPSIYMLTLSTTISQQNNLIRECKFRKSIKQIREVNMNFCTYLDHAYYLKEMQKSSLFMLKEEEKKNQSYKYGRISLDDRVLGYRSLLMSYPRIYEYELYSITNNLPTTTTSPSYTKLLSTLTKSLESSLQILASHQQQCSSYYDQTSSPKIKCLILNREAIHDFISPLLYGYFYGPLTEECINREKLIQGREHLTSKGKMFNLLFEKDFNQAANYITSITHDKTLLEGQQETNYFYKAKHIITKYQDPSPIELALHISVWKQSKQYGLNRLKAASTQQDLANRIDQYGRKVSNSKALNKIKNWIIQANEQQEKYITEEELIKLGIIAQITGNLWFFHDSSLKKLFDSEANKNKFKNFISRKQSISTHKLQQKPQPEDEQRSQLYRHQPKLVKICQKWLREILGKKDESKEQLEVEIEFKKNSINNDIMRNRDFRLVIIIDGIVGYNEIALLRRMMKTLTDKPVAICAESFCSTQQYAEYLTRPVQQASKKTNNINNNNNKK